MICSYALFRHSASNYESDRAGVAKGVFFAGFLPALVRAHLYVWPKAELRIYHDTRAMEWPYFKVLHCLAKRNLIRLCNMETAETLCGSMLWRLRPLWDESSDYVVCRDIDSLPMPRDRKMVEEWIESGSGLHVIHDSESHTGPLMGGMVAIRGKTFRQKFLKAWPTWERFLDDCKTANIDLNKLGADQTALNLFLYPPMTSELIIHTKRPYAHYACKRAMPARLKECEEDKLFNHIGGSGDADRARRWYDEMLPNPQILECEDEASYSFE